MRVSWFGPSLWFVQAVSSSLHQIVCCPCVCLSFDSIAVDLNPTHDFVSPLVVVRHISYTLFRSPTRHFNLLSAKYTFAVFMLFSCLQPVTSSNQITYSSGSPFPHEYSGLLLSSVVKVLMYHSLFLSPPPETTCISFFPHPFACQDEAF